MVNKNKSTGFTLIELLVVIAIIGILAVIVLASLGVARTRSVDAKIKSQLSSMRSEAQLYNGVGNAVILSDGAPCPIPGGGFDATGTIFDTANNGIGKLYPLQNETTPDTQCVATAGTPASSQSKWAVAWPLSNGWFCVDSANIARNTNTSGNVYDGATTGLSPAITTDQCN